MRCDEKMRTCGPRRAAAWLLSKVVLLAFLHGSVAHAAVPGDACSGALAVASLPYGNMESTSAATTATNDPTPACGNGAKHRSVWYAFTPATDLVITADTIGSNYDTILSVYTGFCGTLSPVPGACNDNAVGLQSQVSFSVSAGTTYYFMISASTTTGGTLVFNVKAAATPTATRTATPISTPTSTYTTTATPSYMLTPTPTASALACVVGTGTGASCTESALNACLPGGGSFDGAVTFNCGGAATITVTSTKTISADTTIDGASLITISGGNSVGLFSVNTGVKFTVQNLTIANGNSEYGGAIINRGTLTVTNSTFSGNTGITGGIDNSGTLTVTNSTFSGNSATDGGGIYNGGTLTVTNSTFSGNSAVVGGGIDAGEGTVTVTNSTFSGNSASDGGGGIFSYGNGTVTVTNSIVANSTCAGYGPVTDGGHNIDDGTTCGFTGTGCTATTGTSLCNTNPVLDPTGLQNNGGPTQTVALCTGTGVPSAGCTGASPGINAGDESVCSTTTGTAPVDNLDQRGAVRPGAGAANCSIGAFEANSAAPCVVGTGTGASCTESALTACLPGGGSFTGTVIFNCGGAATITVTSTKTISADTTIDGGSLITISGGNSVGVFAAYSSGVKFTVQNLTIANGFNFGNGGGIYNYSGTLTVTNSTFSGNSASGGGGILNGGTLTVTNSTFSGNSAGGGGIYNFGTLAVTNSTFSGNSAVLGGFGGGISNNGGTLTVTNTTFSGNSADAGHVGGIYNFHGGTVIVTDTIVANSTSGGNCAGAITDGGHNIDDDGTCGVGPATNPLLDPAGLASNGGPTQTIALQAGSPAINVGDESVCAASPVNGLDQRGYVRPGTGATRCSIGAYEYNAVPPSLTPTPTPLNTLVPANTATNTPLPTSRATNTPTTSMATLTPTSPPSTPATPTGNACVVGTGASASCTESALDACLPGGGSFDGTVTFNCGGAATITVTSTKTISADTTIDGGSLITISGGNSVGVFSNYAKFTVQNLTIANGNSADPGGGISNNGTLTVTNSTFSGNSADNGGGIYNGGTLTVTNTIVAKSTSGGNCGGAITDGGHNIDDGTTCGFTGTGCTATTGTSFCNTNPVLDPTGLQNNGGPTQTVALCTGTGVPSAGCTGASPAINAGDENVCSTTTGTAPVDNVDQRGFVRPGTGAANCSIGAFEANSAAPTATPTSATSTPTPTATSTPAPTPGSCVGDCNSDGRVTVDEVLTMVNIALGNTPVTTCEAGDANHDGQITVDEILTAVNDALNEC